ncbi:phage tail tape measure protein [Celerinatantimonas sp. MCCC 1A17872]|uniref:phage tail tape measure protein n=1 Tax=Celerinatantimonas sp. MCCC 1A17872 TaxID=3177514 RepID=UPI0038CB9FBC
MADEKIKVVIDTVVQGAKQITATTTATERLTQAIAQQRDEVKGYNSQLKSVQGFADAQTRVKKLAQQLDDAKAAVTRFDGEITQSKQTTQTLRAAYYEAKSELSQLNRQMKHASGDGLQALQAKARLTQQRMASLNTQVSESKAKTDSLTTSYRKAQSRVTSLNGKYQSQRESVGALNSKLREAGLNTDRLSDEQKRLERASEKATAALARQGEQLRKRNAIQSRIQSRNAKLGDLRSQAVGLGVAAASMGAPMWMAMKNESSFADVTKVVNMSPEQAAQLRSWSLKTSTTTPMSANDINAMLAAGGQSGLSDIAQLKQFELDSAKMGVAFDMDAGQAGKTLAVFKASLGLDQSGALNLAGLANLLSNNQNSRASDIADVLARQGATAKTAGFHSNETAALASALLATGMESERASTAVKNISSRLTLGNAAASSEKSALAQMGFSAPELAGQMQTDASGTLLKVLGAINKAPKNQRSALISQIFGQEVTGAVAALAGNTQNLTQALALANRGEKANIQSLNQEYQTRLNTSENGVELFTNKLSRLAVVVGEALLPALNTVLIPLGNGINMLADLAEKHQTLTATLGIAAGGVIALKGALLAGKAISLLFGNALDKSRLARLSLNRETRQGGRTAAWAAKQWDRLSGAVANSAPNDRGGSGGGLGGESRRRSRRDVRARARRMRFGRRRRGLGGLVARVLQSGLSQRAGNYWHNGVRGHFPGKGLALAGIGGTIASMPLNGWARDLVDIGGDVAEGAGKHGLARVFKPLGIAMDAGQIAEGIQNGSGSQTGSALGDMAGGMGGGALGAAIGTMILPGIGTAVGGLLGSIAGGMGGSAIGQWFGSLFDSPDKTAAKVAEVQHKEATVRQQPPVTFAPVITVNPEKGQKPQDIAKQVIQQMNDHYATLMGGNTIATQMSHSAIDYDS